MTVIPTTELEQDLSEIPTCGRRKEKGTRTVNV